MLRSFAPAMVRLLALMLVASFLGALLIRAAPGFSSDEQELNFGLSSESIQAIRQAHLADSNILRFYFHYLGALVRGDLGQSRSLNQPVGELLRERLPVTLRSLALILMVGWIAGLALATVAQIFHSRFLTAITEALSGTLISAPAAALALVFVLLRWPPVAAAALLLFPKIYRYSSNLLREGYDRPHVLMARARGTGRWRTLLWHVTPTCLPQAIALFGVTISIAIGVLLPIEVVCDVPGIGQLAWQAAQSRDLSLLVNLTMVVTFLTVCATTLSDAARRSLTGSAA